VTALPPGWTGPAAVVGNAAPKAAVTEEQPENEDAK
jgi:hypothetical protein